MVDHRRGSPCKCGQMHAERNAIASLRDSAEERYDVRNYGALLSLWQRHTLYAERLSKTGIARVVIGSKDPNPKVAGKGVQKC